MINKISRVGHATHEDQGGIEVLVVLLDVVNIILCGFPLVHRIEIESGIVVLDGLEECSECILEAASLNGQRREECAMSNTPFRIDLQWSGLFFGRFTRFCALHG